MIAASAVMPANAPVTCVFSTLAVLPASRSASTSPMQTTGTMPCLSAVCSFLFTISSVSAKYCRRSEWPMSVCVPPTAFSCPIEVSPV